MKTTTQVWLVLIAVAWFLLASLRRPAALRDSVSFSTRPSGLNPAAEPANRSIKRVESIPMPAATADVPAIESGWAKEMRELKELAAQNAEAALARVGEMSEKHERKSAAQAVCLIVADTDPAKAMLAAWSNDLGKFSDESTENIAVETLAKRWAEADLVKAFVWASALPADDEARRDRVVKGIALALAQVAPAEAARMIAQHIHPDSSVHIDAAIEVLRTWAAQEYPGAMAWASLFPAGALRERGLEELANAGPISPANESKTN